MKKQIEDIDLTNIVPDEEQPRKYFDVERLNNLRGSIEKYGIRQPLVVEEMIGGKYLLVDGERRYRAAKLLKLKTVPAIVNPSQDATARLVEQFQLQEQHEGWTAIEKAKAIEKLAKSMKVPYRTLCDALKLPERTVRDYLAFGKLMNRDVFERSDVSVGLAKSIVHLRNAVAKRYEEVNEKMMPKDLEKKFEKAVIVGFSNGVITNPNDLGKIRASIDTDIKTLDKFLEGGKSVKELFSETEAKASYFFRSVLNSMGFIQNNVNSCMTAKGIDSVLKAHADEKRHLLLTAKKLTQLANMMPDKE